MIARFLVASTNEGLRRTVIVHVYETTAAMQAASSAYAPGLGDGAGATTSGLGFRFKPDEPATATFGPVAIVRLSAEHLTARIISHEMTHAAMHTYWTCGLAKGGSKLVAHMHAANEFVAYMVGDWTAEAIDRLRLKGLEVTT